MDDAKLSPWDVYATLEHGPTPYRPLLVARTAYSSIFII